MRCRLIVEAHDSLGPITADPTRPKQVLLSVLSNACKLTKEGRSPCGCARWRTGTIGSGWRWRKAST